jgi:hypothetical protein
MVSHQFFIVSICGDWATPSSIHTAASQDLFPVKISLAGNKVTAGPVSY